MVGRNPVFNISRQHAQRIVYAVVHHGGQWFSETDTGESNGYLMAEVKSKVFNPIGTRITTHVYNNKAMPKSLEWTGGVMMGWLVIINVIEGYG